jgi:WD40 repeat protein/signal transduction histidine kinase/DNA-binding response OmpR family regulator
MPIKSAKSLSNRISPKLSLRTVVIVPFVFQIFTVVGLVGCLSYKNGQRAINDVATQLLNEVTARVEQNLEAYLAIPHQVNQINAAAISLNQLNLRDSSRLERHFWQQIQIFESLTFAGLGLEQKNNLGAERLDDGTITIRTSTKDTGHIFRTYSTNQHGDRQKLLDSIPFDPRTRPWYKAAVTAKRETWSEIYPNTAGITAYLGASKPFYNKQGRLQGVLLTNINLSQIGGFLRSLTIGKNGQVFIIERSGMLVATSTGEKPYHTLNKKYGTQRVKATNSKNALTRSTAQYLASNSKYNKQTQKSQQLKYNVKGKQHFVQLKSFHDEFGLDWQIVVVVPETDFIGQMKSNTRTTILLCITASGVAAVVGLLTYRWILQPILRLNTAAKAIALGEWSETVDIRRSDELGELAKSFNNMALQLKKSFATLEAKNADMQHLNTQLQNLDRLKDEFLANTSHELRTPLNGIIGIAESLLEQKSEPLSQLTRSNLAMITASGRRLSNLVNDILDFSQLKHKNIQLHLKSVGVREIAEIILTLNRPLIDQKVLQLINAIPLDLPLAKADENRLQQIFYNLVGNAIKFTDSGIVELSATVVDDYLAISVCDTGIGIREDKLNSIFNSFEQAEGTTERFYGGTGLGLTISKQLVELHGGTFKVESTLDVGSRFTFTLPVSDNQQKCQPTQLSSLLRQSVGEIAQENYLNINQGSQNTAREKLIIPASKSATSLNIKQRKQILVVDDEPINRQVVINYLSLHDYAITEASSGLEALALLEKIQPDLILLDVMMPRMTGYEVIQQIRSSKKLDNLPILLLSAKNQTSDLVVGLEIGANDYLTKPIVKDELIARLKTHLNLRQLKAETQRQNTKLRQVQDQLIESNRNLEQKVLERTQELSQTLKILKATQAQLVVENTLLRNAESTSTYDYQVGGSLSMDTPYYVVRSADCQLYNALKQGKFCYILNARQMGKSSLMVRMIHNLQQEGYRCTAIDMTRISNENITPEQWYKGLAVELWQGFDLCERVNLKTWWNEHKDLSLIQRLSQFIEEILLGETKAEDNLDQPPIVIFFDEIDSVLSLDFSVDDLFALIRACYNQRSINQEYRRLTFALFGVATPSNLISDRQQTPFNIGQAIQLEGFKLHKAQPLQAGLQSKTSNPQLLLKEVLAWTNGQPFLTQKLCQLIRSDSVSVPTNNLAKWIEQFVRTHVIKNWQSQDEPEHFKTIRDRLLSNEQKIGSLLTMYQQILQRGFILVDNSIEQQELMLSGLIIKQRGKLIVRNRIYQEVFDLLWVETQLFQLRPYSEALRAWQKSEYMDSSRLLRGKALQDAQIWSRGKSLSNVDYRFLASSEKLDRKEAQQALETERAQEIEARLLEKQRTNRIQRTFLIALSFSLSSALGVGAIAYKQYCQAAFNEIKALGNYSEALFASDRRLEALITAIKVKQKWQKLNYQDENTDNQIESVLRQAVYGVDEYNRLSGHTEVVFGVDISPNGQLIATGSSDRTVKLWKPDGTLINTFKGHQAAVWDVAFSPDDKTIASASRDHTVKLWHQDDRLLNTLKGHQDEVVGISFSPDGQTIASASRDHTVKLWDRDGNVIDTLKGHQSSVWKAVFSPDDQMIVTASEDKTVKLWKIDAQGRFKLYQTLRGHTDEIRDVAFSPDGQTIASVSHDQTAKLWEASSGKLLHTLEGHSSPVLGVVFSPDNQIVATTGWDGMVKVFNLEGALLKTINIDKKRIWDIDISLDGNSIATASEQDLVKLSKLDNPLLKVLRSHSAPIIDVAFNPQGNIIATASDDRTVKLWSKNGSLLTTFKSNQDSVLGIAWNPDGHRLVSGHWNGAINFLRVKNLNSPQIHLDKTIPGHKVGVWRIAVSPNGKLIATASEDKTAKIWDWQGNLITSLIGHQDVVRAVAFSSDSKIVATASYDETVKLWNTQGKIIVTLKEHNNGVGAVTFSPDGKMMATADLEGTIKLWQIEQEQGRVSVKLNKTLKSHTEEVRKIIFSPDGRLIASASEGNTIKIWHHNGELLKTFYGHEAAVWSLAFSPDGKTLASVSEDQTVIIWNLQQMFELDLLAAGCNQIEDYLRTNAEVSQSDRLLCDPSHELKYNAQ